jgi:nitrous oxidase accessory protein
MATGVVRRFLLLLFAGWWAASALPARAGEILVVAPDARLTRIEEALAMAQDGDTIEVRGGVYDAPLMVEKSVSLIGIDRPIIDGHGDGSLVLINAPDVLFQGFTLRNTGTNLSHEDCAIIAQAPRVTIADNTMQSVLFGIYFNEASDGIARNNVIHGIDLDESMRGDSIRVFYSHNVTLENNLVMTGRDTLIWYADYVTIRGNQLLENRYGLHFMYNTGAVVEENIIADSMVGAYMMYSADLTFARNEIVNNRGASGYGLALKDMDNAHIRDNLFAGNSVGLFLDNSPSRFDIENTILDNLFAYNDAGIMALPMVANNLIQANTFLENTQQVAVQGRGNLQNNTWSRDGLGNYWSDYIGYDEDGDGIGDLAYRSEKLFESLTDRNPALRLFTFSPATQALDFAAGAFPSLRPDPKLVDDAPRMTFALPAALAAGHETSAVALFASGLLLLVIGSAIVLPVARPFGKTTSERRPKSSRTSQREKGAATS